jgi:hypothetical protein
VHGDEPAAAGRQPPHFYTMPATYTMQTVAAEDDSAAVYYEFNLRAGASAASDTVVAQGILRGFAPNGTAEATEVQMRHALGCSDQAAEAAKIISPDFQVDAWLGAQPTLSARFQCTIDARYIPMPNFACTYPLADGSVERVHGTTSQYQADAEDASHPCKRRAESIAEPESMHTDCFWGETISSGGKVVSFDGNATADSCLSLWAYDDLEWYDLSRSAYPVDEGQVTCKTAFNRVCADALDSSVLCPANPQYSPANTVQTLCYEGVPPEKGSGPGSGLGNHLAVAPPYDPDDCHGAAMRAKGWVEKSTVNYLPMANCAGFNHPNFTYWKTGEIQDTTQLSRAPNPTGSTRQFLLSRWDANALRAWPFPTAEPKLVLSDDSNRAYGHAARTVVNAPAIDFTEGDYCYPLASGQLRRTAADKQWSARVHFESRSYVHDGDEAYINQIVIDEAACTLQLKVETHLCDAQ